MAEKSNKRSGGWKQFSIETKRAVLNYFAEFDSRDMDFHVYVSRHQDQSIFGNRQNGDTRDECQLRKKLNDYKLKLGKDAEFLHLELARNGFHTVSGRPLTLHPQLKKKIDGELKLQDVLPVSEPKTSLSTQQTPNDKSSSQQTSDSELSTEQNLDELPASPLQQTGNTQTKTPVI